MRGGAIRLAAVAAIVALTGVGVSAATEREMLSVSMVHRGDGFERPENSLEAILHCWANGAIPESDIWRTKDGVLVAYHDASLRGRPIVEWTWDELRTVDIGSERGAAWRGVGVPTWEAIFASMKGRPDRKVFMDWKDPGPMPALAKTIRDWGLERQVYCHAGHYPLLRSWRRAMPEGLCSYWVWIGSWSHIDFGAEGAVAKGEAFMRGRMALAEADGFACADIVHLLIQCDFSRPDPFCPTTPYLKEAVAKVHAAGRLITAFPWAEDGKSAEAYSRFRELGFDGWGTDYPSILYALPAK